MTFFLLILFHSVGVAVYYYVHVSQDDGRAVSFVRKETLLALYIRADNANEAKVKLEMFKKLFPLATYSEPQMLWVINGWMIFMAYPRAYDVVWNVYRWTKDTTFFCSANIGAAALDEYAFL